MTDEVGTVRSCLPNRLLLIRRFRVRFPLRSSDWRSRGRSEASHARRCRSRSSRSADSRGSGRPWRRVAHSTPCCRRSSEAEATAPGRQEESATRGSVCAVHVTSRPYLLERREREQVVVGSSEVGRRHQGEAAGSTLDGQLTVLGLTLRAQEAGRRQLPRDDGRRGGGRTLVPC